MTTSTLDSEISGCLLMTNDGIQRPKHDEDEQHQGVDTSTFISWLNAASATNFLKQPVSYPQRNYEILWDRT